MSLHAFDHPSRIDDRADLHTIAEIEGSLPGPLFIAVGGVHGNEPAGVEAARQVARALRGRESVIAGTIAFYVGNTEALARGVRFVDADLNRRWSADHVERARAGEGQTPRCAEDDQVRGLLAALDRRLEGERRDVFVVDLHTTSAGGVPFATLGDTLRNRAFAEHFPVPIILGIEENLDGTLLEHVNGLGCVTLGFEGGQHDAAASIDSHESLLWVALVATGNLQPWDVPAYDTHRRRLAKAGGGPRFVEIRHRHAVRPGDGFRMEPGFANFAPIRKGQVLAHDWRGPILAPESGMILMPLYQPLGDDGFFVVREVRPFWLRLSKALRRLRLPELAAALPGVRRLEGSDESLIVNTALARLFPLQVFHLLGYRKRRWADGLLVVSRRRFDARPPETIDVGGTRADAKGSSDGSDGSYG
jgi:hypothetical protein